MTRDTKMMSRVLKNSSLMKAAGSIGEPASHLYADFIYTCHHDDCKYGFSSHESDVHAGPQKECATACSWFASFASASRGWNSRTNIQRPLPMTILAILLPILPWKTVDTVLASLWLLFSVHVDITSSIATWNRLAGLVVDATGWLTATTKVL